MSDEDWNCSECGKRYVVVSLARECERKHEEGK